MINGPLIKSKCYIAQPSGTFERISYNIDELALDTHVSFTDWTYFSLLRSLKLGGGSEMLK